MLVSMLLMVMLLVLLIGMVIVYLLLELSLGLLSSSFLIEVEVMNDEIFLWNSVFDMKLSLEKYYSRLRLYCMVLKGFRFGLLCDLVKSTSSRVRWNVSWLGFGRVSILLVVMCLISVSVRSKCRFSDGSYLV